MNGNTAFRNWLLAFAGMVIAVVLCVAYVDRPAAEFFDEHFRNTIAWVWVAGLLAPLDLVVVTALFFLFGCGTWVLSGRSLGAWTRTPLLCSWAAMWATAADIIFKRMFGRSGAETYVRDHFQVFDLLRGAHGVSFPSGTASISAAIVAVLWAFHPRFRAVSALIVALLCVAVVVTNFHWLSDVIAGSFLGVSIGWMTVRLQPVATGQP